MDYNRIFKFRTAWKQFLDATAYMAKKRLSIKEPMDPLWLDAVKKFENDVTAPIDRMWDKMSIEEKTEFNKQMGYSYGA